MNSLQRELQTLTAQIEEQDDLLRPLEKEVEKAEKKAAKECERDDATMLGKEIWKELDGLSDDLQKCRASATTALRAASRQVSTKRLRVRLRLSGRIVKEPKQIHVVTSKGQRAAVEAIVQASQELDACRDVGAYARRSMRRLTQCAKNRIKVVESQLPGPLPAKPQIADAEAAFASAGLKTPDAVEDCLVCWDFMTTFRDSPVLPARDDNSFLMLPETRLDEFAAALQAPNDDLIRRPEQHNPFRYLAHVHKELLKLIMTDEETDRWWPSPKKSYGPRWWARPELPQKPQPLLQRFEAATPSQPSRIMCQIGAIQATCQPVPVPLLALALQELRYPQPVVDACSQGHPLGQEILLKVGRAAQDAHRAAQTNGTRTGQASAEELAAFRAFQDSKRAQQAAQDSPPAPAPDAPPSAEELKLREELEALKRENAKLKTPAGAVAGAAACAEGALAACGKAARKAKKVASSCNSKAAKTAVEPQQPTRVSARARRKAPPRNEIGFESTPKTRGNNGRRAPGSGLPGGRAKPLNAAQRAALPLHLNDLLQLLKHDAGTRDCPRFPPAVVGSTTWAPLAAAACARIADYAAATAERCGAYDEWGGLEGDIVVHQRPGGGDDATRQGWSPAHRQQFFDPYKEDPESVDEPSTQEPACVVRDPLNGKTALREACASLLKGEPYGDLDPSQRCALLRTLIDAALNTKTVTEEINKRATKIANAESAISASRRVEAPSRHRRASSPGMMEVGGLFVEFGAVRTAPRR